MMLGFILLLLSVLFVSSWMAYLDVRDAKRRAARLDSWYREHGGGQVNG